MLEIDQRKGTFCWTNMTLPAVSACMLQDNLACVVIASDKPHCCAQDSTPWIELGKTFHILRPRHHWHCATRWPYCRSAAPSPIESPSLSLAVPPLQVLPPLHWAMTSWKIVVHRHDKDAGDTAVKGYMHIMERLWSADCAQVLYIVHAVIQHNTSHPTYRFAFATDKCAENTSVLL